MVKLDQIGVLKDIWRFVDSVWDKTNGQVKVSGGGGGGGGATQAEIETAIESASNLVNIATQLTTIDGRVDGIEALIGTTNTSLSTLNEYVDSLEALVTALSIVPTDNTIIRTLTAQASETNTAPVSFVSIAGSPTKYTTIAVTAEDIDCTNAPSAVVIYVWKKSGSDDAEFIGFVSAVPRINNLADGLYNSGVILFDVYGVAADGYNVKVQLPVQSFSFTVDVAANTALINASGLKANTLVNLTTSGVLPLGLSGFITAIATSSDVATVSDASFVAGESCRINAQTIGTTIIPQLGLSYRFSANNVNLIDDTITFNAANSTQYLLQPGDTIRFRAAPGNTLPSIAGGAIAATTTYTVLTATGSAGAQTITLTTDGATRADLTAIGLGNYLYAFRFPFTPLTYLSGGQLSYDGATPIDFIDDISDAPITVSAQGTPASVAHTAHGLSIGQAFQFGGTTAPGLAQLGVTYYVGANGFSANAYQVCLVPSGPAVAFTSAGSAVTVNGTAVTVTAGTPATFTYTNHFLAALQPFRFGGSLPGTITSDLYYVIANGLTASTFQASQLPASPPVAVTSAGTSVTLTALVSGVGSVPFERTQAFVRNPTQTTIQLSNQSGGAVIDIKTLGSGTHTLTPVNAPTVTGTVKARVVA